MKPGPLAALGIGLVGAGYLYFVAFFFPRFGLAEPLLLAAGVGLGMLAAAAGMASLPSSSGRSLLALGFGIAAACAVGYMFTDLSSLDLIGHLLVAVGLVQAAAVSVLWFAEDGAKAEARVAGLQLSLVAVALAGAWYVASTLYGTGLALEPGPGAVLLGAALAAKALRDGRLDLGRTVSEADPAEA